MANLHLVTGYAGKEHITSNDQGSFNAAIMGTGEFVLERGKQFAAQVISNNTVRIFDGDLLMQGRHIRLKENTYVDLFFENGTQGYKRTDLIAVRYEKDATTDIESASLVVIKGVTSEDEYIVPEKITGDIINGHALQNDTVLYQVKFDGLGIQEPEKVFSTVPTLETIKTDTIEQIKQEAEKVIKDTAYAVDELIPLFGYENPTSETKGRLKQFFINIDTGGLFVCTGAGEKYAWTKVGGNTLAEIPLSHCGDLALGEGYDRLTLTWTDPEDVVFNGQKVAEWAGTKVLRKEGSYSINQDDGVLIMDSKERNQYSENGLEDMNGLLKDTDYFYTLFPYTNKKIYTVSDYNRIKGSLLPYDPVLANNTWAQISEASRLGLAKQLWNLGDSKEGCTIIGFDHDDLSDGSGKAGITFVSSKQDAVAWNTTGSTSQYIYYENATIRTETLPELKSKLPEDLKIIIREVKKSSLTGTASSISGVKFINEELFLPSPEEIYKENYMNGIYKEGERYEGFEGFWLSTNITWTRTLCANFNSGASRNLIMVLAKTDYAEIEWSKSFNYVYCFCV